MFGNAHIGSTRASHKIAHFIYLNLSVELATVTFIMIMSDKVKFVKARKGELSLSVSEITSATESQLDLWVEQLKASGSDDTKIAETPVSMVRNAVEGNGTFTTDKGEVITIANLEFIGRTTSGGFRFAYGESSVVTNDKDLAFLNSKKPLVPGQIVAFVPDSIVFNATYNCFTGTPNKSATPELRKALEYRLANREHLQAVETEMIASGLKPSEARDAVREHVKADVLASFKRPTFEL